MRDYFRALAGDVRNDMATRSVNSASARTSVAARACRQALQTKDVVKVEAYRAAASLLKEAGDTWVTAPSATLSAVYLSGQTIWSDIVKVKVRNVNMIITLGAPRQCARVYFLLFCWFP